LRCPTGRLLENESTTGPVSNHSGKDLLLWLTNELSDMVATFLNLDGRRLSTDKILLDLGFDSIGLTTFAMP